MRDHLRLESDEYVRRLVRCNEAIGVCLGFPIRNAKDHRKALKCLSDGTWPTNAPATALKHVNEFPWLPLLFLPREPGQPAPRVPIWDQAAEDLFRHPPYRAWLYKLAKRYVDQHSPPKPSAQQKEKEPPETPGDRASEALGSVLWRAFLIVVGKAEHCLQRRQEQPHRSWLDFALDFARSEVGNEIREEETGIRRKPEKLKSGEEVKRPRRRSRPETDMFPPGLEDLRPPEPQTDRDEQPEVIAEASELEVLVWAELRQQPHEQQRVLQLLLLEGRSLKEAALEMGLSAYRTKQLLAAAQEALRHRLQHAVAAPKAEPKG
jgi:DNA-directed RNA polymerase specialized sigma24 family protein